MPRPRDPFLIPCGFFVLGLLSVLAAASGRFGPVPLLAVGAVVFFIAGMMTYLPRRGTPRASGSGRRPGGLRRQQRSRGYRRGNGRGRTERGERERAD